MKVLKSKAFAIVVMVLVILGAACYGLSKKPSVPVEQGTVKLDESLSTAAYAMCVVDEANVLSAKTENTISLYNANWDKLMGSIMAVVTVKTDGAESVEDLAWAWAESLELAENDAILVLDVGVDEYFLLPSPAGRFEDLLAGQSPSFLNICLLEYTNKGNYDGGVLNLEAQIHQIVSDTYGYRGTGSAHIGANAAVVAFLLLVFLLLVIESVDRARYRRWYGRYGTMAAPPVVYRPMVWWHRPSSRWYNRRYTYYHDHHHGHHAPPPPHHHGGGYGGSYRPSAPPRREPVRRDPPRGGFSGGSSGSSRGSFSSGGTRGGFSGGGHSSSRGGSFGGSRGGGFSGGGHSSGRGGGFGGRR